MQRGLVAAQIHLDALLGAVFPKVHHIALIGKRAGYLLGSGLVHSHKQFVKVGVNLVHPALLVTLLRGGGIDFGGDAHHSRNVASLGLGTAHATEASGDKQLACCAAAQFAGCVEDGNGGAMHNALRADVHIAASGHLAVLRHAEGVITLPVVGLAVVGNHHTVGHHHTGSILVRGIQSHRVAAVHHQRLLVGHLAQILHHQAVLCPVLEHGAVSAVGNQFVRMLCHSGVQVVLNHQHDGGSLAALGGILVNGAGIHLVGGAQTVHINASVFLQLLGKLRSQHSVVLGVKITEGVTYCQLLLCWGQDILALGRMVYGCVIRLGCRQRIGNAGTQFILKFFECHIFICLFIVESNIFTHPNQNAKIRIIIGTAKK